jgi:hypothetical protein
MHTDEGIEARRACPKLAGGDNRRITATHGKSPGWGDGNESLLVFRRPYRGSCFEMAMIRWLRPPTADLPTG